MEEEIWKDIPNYEGFYQVSNLGRVKSLSRTLSNRPLKGKILKQFPCFRGYMNVVLCKNTYRKHRTVHQLVSEAFLGFTPCGHKLVPNHKDYNKSNNRLENLEIVTQRVNACHTHFKTTSKYTGVSWHKRAKKWIAQIYINGEHKYIGLFTSEIEASQAYQNELNSMLVE